MIPASYRPWLILSLGLHALALVVLGQTSLPAPRQEAQALVPIRFLEPEAPPAAPPPAPKPKVSVAPKPAPEPPKPTPKPKPRVSRTEPAPKPAVVPAQPRQRARTDPKPASRPGSPTGQRDGTATRPGGGLRQGSGQTSPAPPAVMRTPGGKGMPAPPGRPGGTGTQGTGEEPAGPTTGPVRLGGALPTYPKLAEDAGEEGTVVVTVTISPSGEVQSASVSRSSGHDSLDAAALRAARSWKFKPALQRGKPVVSTQSIRFHFAGGSVSGG